MGADEIRGSAGWWDERYHESAMLWTHEPNRFVVEEAADLAPGRALDLACGEGRNALWLATRGWQVTAVDFSGVALERGRRLAAEAKLQVEWVEADVLSWQPAESGYDLVLLGYLQLPAGERQTALSLAASAVASRGSLLVVAHDLRNLAEGTGGPQDPALLWTPDEVERPGFAAARAETAERPVDDEIALDTVVRLVRTG